MMGDVRRDFFSSFVWIYFVHLSSGENRTLKAFESGTAHIKKECLWYIPYDRG